MKSNRVAKSNRRIFSIVSAAGLALAFAACAGLRPATGIVALLPGGDQLPGLSAIDAPRTYRGEELFKLIDGGAEIFLANGFQEVAVQEYGTEDGYLFNLEIYRMASEDAAKKIYELQGNAGGDDAGIGQESALGDYYGLFRQGCYYISVSAYERSAVAKSVVTTIAAEVIKKIDAPR